MPKIIQICAGPASFEFIILIALCEDGSVWQLISGAGSAPMWFPLKAEVRPDAK